MSPYDKKVIENANAMSRRRSHIKNYKKLEPILEKTIEAGTKAEVVEEAEGKVGPCIATWANGGNNRCPVCKKHRPHSLSYSSRIDFIKTTLSKAEGDLTELNKTLSSIQADIRYLQEALYRSQKQYLQTSLMHYDLANSNIGFGNNTAAISANGDVGFSRINVLEFNTIDAEQLSRAILRHETDIQYLLALLYKLRSEEDRSQ